MSQSQIGKMNNEHPSGLVGMKNRALIQINKKDDSHTFILTQWGNLSKIHNDLFSYQKGAFYIAIYNSYLS